MQGYEPCHCRERSLVKSLRDEPDENLRGIVVISPDIIFVRWGKPNGAFGIKLEGSPGSHLEV